MRIVTVLLFVGLVGCGDNMQGDPDMGDVVHASPDSQDELSSGLPGGDVPIGFYQRGCAFDAPCGDKVLNLPTTEQVNDQKADTSGSR